ncbi:PA2778 family cysteine peptidase [Thioalkalivibrio sp. XN279]|uniref:PA2778 family cysteine peptidase n=1 Tax=Thioalkalivibrio sp. XN279 TaxID=2714953 RepID=UPI00140B97E0|nr:PA2778 family cysteine peptidase [Thioalkalivibrio sp. XN279]
MGPERQVLREAGLPVELDQVPFFPQDEYQCGPAALATVLVHSGIDVSPQQLVQRVYVPDRKGSLQAEMIVATRSQGRVPYVLPETLAPILMELRSGQPVLLLQNLRLERWPVWHYAVLVGFDPAAERFLLRSGTTRREERGAVPFLASWDRGGRWAMVVVKAGEPPASADVLGWLRAVAPFESTGDLELAAEGYAAAVARWPDEPMAWTALGNVRYLQGDVTAAAAAYRHALELAPGFRAACENLAQALSELAAAGEIACDEANACASKCGPGL